MAEVRGVLREVPREAEFEGEEVELKNGRRAAQGLCPVCGTKMNRMLGKKA